MGKHKHRRRELSEGYPEQMINNYPGGFTGQPMNGNPQQNMGQGMPMNNGNMNMNNNMMPNQMGQNQYGNMGMNGGGMPQNQMNMGMMNNPLGALMGGNGNINGIVQLLSMLGLGNGGELGQSGGGVGDILGMLGGQQGGGDILSMLGGGQQGGGGDILSMLGGKQGGGDILGMLSNVLGMGGQQSPPSYGTTETEQAKNFSSVEEILAQIRPEDISELQRVLNNMQSEKQEDKKKDDSVEEILANLNFNAILENMNNSNVDFSNIDVNNIDIDELMQEDIPQEVDVDSSDQADADIVDENILDKEKGLTEEEYIKLINVLLKLIDSNKIRLLKKIVDDYGKTTKE